MAAQQFGPWVGVQPKISAQHIRNEYLAYGEDLDLSSNTLRPVRTDRRVPSITTSNDHTIFASDCCIKAFQGCERIAKTGQDCERVFIGTSAAYTQALTGTTNELCSPGLSTIWGWPCQFNAPTVVYSSAAQSDRIAEPRSYVYTYTNKYGEESQPSLPSPTTILDFAVSATIAGFAIIPPQYGATNINVYVMVAGLSSVVGGGTEGSDEYLLVAKLPISQVMFTHSPTAQPLGKSLGTDTFVPIPADATDPQHWGSSNLAFVSQGALRFTEPWNYSLAPLKYTYKPKDNLVRIAATQEFVYLLTCGQPEVVATKSACDMTGTRASSVANDSFPIIGRNSVATYENSVIFASVMGLVHMNAANVKTITDEVFTQAQWDALQPQTMIGACYQGYYYGATDTTCFRLEMPRGPKSNHAEKFSFLSIRPTAWVVTDDDRLLYSDATGTHEMGQGDDFKTYTATTKDIFEPNQRVHGAIRVVSKPGTLAVTQTSVSDNSKEFPETIQVKAGGIHRYSRRLGSGVRYTLRGQAEVTAFIAGDSVASVTSR